MVDARSPGRVEQWMREIIAWLNGADSRATYANYTAVSTTPYAVAATDVVLLLDSTAGAITINLPALATNRKRVLVVKDAAGTAAANNLTLDGSGAETIDGAATLVMATNRQTVRLYAGPTEWNVL